MTPCGKIQECEHFGFRIKLRCLPFKSVIFLSSIQKQLDAEAETMRMAQKEFLSVEDTVYMPDKETETVNRTLIQKAGYLNIRK